MAAQVLKAASVVVRPGSSAGGVVDRALFEQAVEEAYRTGVADGRDEAEASHTAAVPRLAAAIEQLAVAVRAAQDEERAALTSDTVDMAIEVARWVCGRELATDVAALTARVEAALSDLMPTSTVVLEIAPEMAESLSEWADDGGIEIRPRADLAPGEARLVAGHARADLTFDAAVERLRHVLAADLGTGGDGDDELARW